MGKPILNLFQGDNIILSNDDWNDAPNAPALAAAADAALLVTLMPGNYTAQAIGLGGTTGNVLIEVYEVP